MKEYFQILKKLRTNLINLLCFELLYRAALFAAVLQGARIWFNYALKRMGYSYLTAENYPVFIRNGWTLAGLAVFLVVILAALFLEICVISKSWFYGFAGQSRGIRETFFSGFHLFLSLLRKNFPGCGDLGHDRCFCLYAFYDPGSHGYQDPELCPAADL